MKIKVKCIETGAESVFESQSHHIAIHFAPEELSEVKLGIPDTEDGLSLSGKPYRTFGLVVETGDEEEMQRLMAWTKEE